MINKKAWEKSSPSLQAKIKYAALATMVLSLTNSSNADYENAWKFPECIGINILDSESLAKIEQIAYKYFEDEAEKNPLFAKVIYLQYQFYKKTFRINEVQQSILNRTPALPNTEKLKAAAEKAK